MNKKLIIYTIIILLSHSLFAAKKAIVTKVDKAVQTEKLKNNLYSEMKQQLKNIVNKDEYYKTNLFMAKKLYEKSGGKHDYTYALDFCSTAMDYEKTKKEAKKLFFKIVVKLQMLLVFPKRPAKTFRQRIEEIVHEILEEEEEEEEKGLDEKPFPPGMYI